MDISVLNLDITQIAADLIVMKHADGFYGADKAVANTIGFYGQVERGRAIFVSGIGLVAPEVLFIGVGPLYDFRYREIQAFGTSAVKLSRKHNRPISHLALTIHGPGYGLDPEQAFLSMIAGIVAEWKREKTPLAKLTVVDQSARRCEILDRLLKDRGHEFGLLHNQRLPFTTQYANVPKDGAWRTFIDSNVVNFGARAEQKSRLFVAMPFSNDFVDEFEIGFHEAAKASEYVCERLDLEAFTGDIVAEIRKRIQGSHGVIALLNDHNPNVFLEVGFAWAHGKPTILVAKEGVVLPFDVSGHRCIKYQSITQLRVRLTTEIASLKAQGVFSKSI
ncbi:MAG TPA: hypothetical protein VKA94_03290 [Hyphomicrobiales bacterium]|nr:hypothetical protein [Hyphomicrobiales bacterium]